SYDVVSILKKGRQDVRDVQTLLEAERAETEPKEVTRIHVMFAVTGKTLKEAQVKRAAELSAEKYCSASIMLGRSGGEITPDYEHIEADSGATDGRAPPGGSDPVGGAGHHPGHQLHDALAGAREHNTPRLQCVVCVFDFVLAHLFENGAGLEVILRQPGQMIVQMPLHQLLGGGDKAQTDAVAD